ncbi:MAG TPA: PP2C family serine/threonine-protein phosphatase [Rhodanobacteraceae bacterium]
MTMHFQSAGRTDTGKVRRRNEDSILVRDDAGLWVVADGLGGHSAGDYASGMIVERLAALPRDGDVFDFVESIEDTLCGINTDLRRTAQQRGVDIIGSTVVLLVHDKDFMLCGWVGDSRAYCAEDGRLAQISRDHVYGVKEDVTQFGGGPGRSQPNGGALTRAVGAEDALFVDWVVAGARPNTAFVLCSDGVNKEMTDDEIEAVCRRRASPQAILDEVFEISLGRAARDNVSAVIVQLQD